MRTVWLKGGDVDHDFMASFPGNSDLADAYENSVARADNTSDVLRDDADAVARAETLRTDIRHQKRALKKLRRAKRDWTRTGRPFGAGGKTMDTPRH
ncbi:hypothetical protein M1M98_02995 [Thermodesulfovibrionales bacterium]|nr:hypothetical protein [Thermodesulfovibrionales bacterium]MCL0051444.1 hypothetical protein [Thermodesulfovibrionales bacterium]